MERIAESTLVRPIIVGLASFIPVVGNLTETVDALLAAKVERDRRSKLETLIEGLGSDLDFSGPLKLYEADVVLHAAYVTIEATLRTMRRQKIRAFGKLLRAGLDDPDRLDLSAEHEDYLKIIDDLSVRELELLSILAEHETERTVPPSGQAKTHHTADWAKFKEQASKRLSIPEPELWGYLTRLTRTGTFEPFTGAVFGYQGGTGKLTPVYYRLAALIQDRPHEFDTGKIV